MAKRTYSEEVKKEAIERMKAADKIAEQMEKCSRLAMQRLYGVSDKVITKIYKGKPVHTKNMDADDIAQCAEKLRRYDKLKAKHETRREIAEAVGASVAVMCTWYSAKSPERVEEDMGIPECVQKFLTMRLTSNPDPGAVYY